MTSRPARITTSKAPPPPPPPPPMRRLSAHRPAGRQRETGSDEATRRPDPGPDEQVPASRLDRFRPAAGLGGALADERRTAGARSLATRTTHDDEAASMEVLPSTYTTLRAVNYSSVVHARHGSQLGGVDARWAGRRRRRVKHGDHTARTSTAERRAGGGGCVRSADGRTD